MYIYDIFTDGACSNNGKIDAIGGWGFVIFKDGIIISLKHGITKNTTNNREELQAILQTLKELEHIISYTDGQIQANIYTDSAYVHGICTDWGWKWQSRDWTRPGGKPIENLDLVKSIFHYLYNNKNFQRCKVQFFKLAGHSNILGNEIADGLATGNNKKIEKLIGRNPEIMGVHINDIYNG